MLRLRSSAVVWMLKHKIAHSGSPFNLNCSIFAGLLKFARFDSQSLNLLGLDWLLHKSTGRQVLTNEKEITRTQKMAHWSTCIPQMFLNHLQSWWWATIKHSQDHIQLRLPVNQKQHYCRSWTENILPPVLSFLTCFRPHQLSSGSTWKLKVSYKETRENKISTKDKIEPQQRH